MDETSGRILRAYRADAAHPPASLAKMMTLYLAFEALEQGRITLGTRVPVSYHAAARGPSKLYLRPGQELTVEQLILAMTVKSANDAAAAMGEFLAGGDEHAFAQRMTAKAREIGMRATTFRNASGLPAAGAYTTAHDMAILARALHAQFPKYAHYFSRRYFRWGARTFRNTNRLLHARQDVTGMKTGYTRASGFNLVVTAAQGERKTILVVLGGRTSGQRYQAAATLLAAAYRGVPAPPPRESVAVAARDEDDEDGDEGVAAKKKPGFSLVARAEANTRLRAPETRAPSAITRFGIQIGSYRNYRQAQYVAKKAYYSVPSAYRSGSTRIAVIAVKQGRRTQYAARLLGFNQAAASQTCRVLARRGLRCQTLSYSVQAAALGSTSAGSGAAKDDIGYGLQIGTYKRFAKARAVAKAAQRKVPTAYRARTKVTVVRVQRRAGPVYAARLEGFRREERAERACSLLERRGYDCDTVAYEL